MSKLRSYSRQEILKILIKNGGQVVRSKGDHVIVKMSCGNSISVPEGEIRNGTLQGIIKASGLTRNVFVKS